jgi:hypothetical protein
LDFNPQGLGFNSRELVFNSRELVFNSREFDFNSEGLDFNSRELAFNSRGLDLKKAAGAAKRRFCMPDWYPTSRDGQLHIVKTWNTVFTVKG